MKKMLQKLFSSFSMIIGTTSVAFAHQTGIPHQHTFFEQLMHSFLKPDHLLILIGVVLVAYLHISRSAGK